jgi:hypothetical protein
MLGVLLKNLRPSNFCTRLAKFIAAQASAPRSENKCSVA